MALIPNVAFGRLAVEVGALAPQKEHRLTFQPALPFLINFEYRPGTGAKRAVVQKNDFRIEQEEFFKRVHFEIRFDWLRPARLGKEDRQMVRRPPA